MDAKTYLYTLATIAGGLAGIGDSFLNKWAKNSADIWSLVVGFLILNISLVVFLLMLKRGYLEQSVILYIVANVLLVFFASFVVFKEPISIEKLFWVGITLFAVIMLESSR